MDLTSLPDEVKGLVRAQLEAGPFQSIDEVVCEALRLLHEREELFASHREELRSQTAEGVAAEQRGELRDGAEAIADVLAASTSGFAKESDLSPIRAHRSGPAYIAYRSDVRPIRIGASRGPRATGAASLRAERSGAASADRNSKGSFEVR